MNRRKYLLKLYKIVGIFEILISFLLVIGIIISIPDIFRYYHQIAIEGINSSYELFQNFLSHILLIVIAVEFVVLMVAHSDTNIIHLIMLVIARKMLVYSHNMLDLLVGVIAIFILFGVRRFLVSSSNLESSPFHNENLYSASITLEVLNKRYGFNIEPKDAETLGGHVAFLLNEAGINVEIGEIVDDGKYMYEVEKQNNGLIEIVSIDSISGNKVKKQ